MGSVLSEDLLQKLAVISARETLSFFRGNNNVTNKVDGGFDPVTEADRNTELEIRKLIRAAYPEDRILGEEFGEEGLFGERTWVIDPIDGTRSFISGIPLWGTLVGVLENGVAVAGTMIQPFTRELFYANGEGTHYQGPLGNFRLAARSTTELSQATLFTTNPFIFDSAQNASFTRLREIVKLSRYGTDSYAYCMLAAGNIDLVVEAGLQPYDIVALIPIIEQAGGVVTNWRGGRAEYGGSIIAAANKILHHKALATLANSLDE